MLTLGNTCSGCPGTPGSTTSTSRHKRHSLGSASFSGYFRAKKHGRGELQTEIGRTHIRDEHGNQIVRVGTVRAYASFPGEMENFASKAAKGFSASSSFREALRVFGRANRDAADFYLVYELAKKEFEGWQGIRDSLGFSKARLDEFRKLANHLTATEGGRHAAGDPTQATLSLDEISRFTTEMVAAWVITY